MLAGLKDVLEIAEKGGFAVPAFNVYNMETVMGIVEAAEEAHAPIIMQSYSRLFTNREGYFVTPIALAAAEQASVPICFHLDHGAGKAEVTRALRYGATGIMIDKSTLPFAENAAQTKEVVELAAAVGVHVEGELGHIGSARDGVPEDCTEVQDAAEFVEKTVWPPLLSWSVQRTVDIKRCRSLPLSGLRSCIGVWVLILSCMGAAAFRTLKFRRPLRRASARSTLERMFAMPFWIRCLKPHGSWSPLICL